MNITKTTKGIIMHNPEDETYLFTFNDEFLELYTDITAATIFTEEDRDYMELLKPFCEVNGLKEYEVTVTYVLEQAP